MVIAILPRILLIKGEADVGNTSLPVEYLKTLSMHLHVQSLV